MKLWKFIKWLVSQTLVQVVAGIIAGTALLYVSIFCSYFRQWFLSLIDILCLRIPIPLWVVIVASLILIGCIVGILLLVVISKTPRSYLSDYHEAEFYGVKWRWDYDDFNNIVKLCPFCAKEGCDMELDKCDYFPNMVDPICATNFHCTFCNEDVLVRDMNYEEIKMEVKKRIQRNIRTGNWK